MPPNQVLAEDKDGVGGQEELAVRFDTRHLDASSVIRPKHTPVITTITNFFEPLGDPIISELTNQHNGAHVVFINSPKDLKNAQK